MICIYNVSSLKAHHPCDAAVWVARGRTHCTRVVSLCICDCHNRTSYLICPGNGWGILRIWNYLTLPPAQAPQPNPTTDRAYAEASVDDMREQKDEELARYRRQSERRYRELAAKREAATSAASVKPRIVFGLSTCVGRVVVVFLIPATLHTGDPAE